MGVALEMKRIVSNCRKEQGNAVFAVHFTVNQLYTTNNTKRFSFKSGRAVGVAKLSKTDWLVVLQ